MTNPKISVLLPVYNGANFIEEAINSILNQSLADFELIIVDDCSTDNSVEIIKSFRDDRIQFIQNTKNSRTAACLNKGIDVAKGKYFARMDQDDIAFPDRFKKQYDFLESNPEVGICGTQIKSFGEGVKSSISKYPLDHECIQLMLLHSPPFAHPSVMMRKAIFDKYHFRYVEGYIAEDYSLWDRILLITKSANLNEPLLNYRIHSSSITKTFYRRIFVEQEEIRLKYALSLFKDLNPFWVKNIFSSSQTIRKFYMNKILTNQQTFDSKNLDLYFDKLNEYFLNKVGWRFYLHRIKQKLNLTN